MANSVEDLRRINSLGRATKGQKYYQDDGKVFIGTDNGRLKPLDKASSLLFKPTENIVSTNIESAIVEVSDSISETAQNAIGEILTNSDNIELTYDSTTPSIIADLTDTTVVAGSYTSSDITVDSKGRITEISNGSSSGGLTQAQILTRTLGA